MTLVSFANYEWFKEWKDAKVTNRGADYKELKQTFIDSALEMVMEIYPKITRDKVRMSMLFMLFFFFCCGQCMCLRLCF